MQPGKRQKEKESFLASPGYGFTAGGEKVSSRERF